MSDETPTAAARESCADSGAAVAAYLLQHPDFFGRHPEVLAALETERRADGVASLSEKRIAVLRKHTRDLESSRGGLIETARTNENLSVCLHHVALALLRDAPARGRLAGAAAAGGVARACREVLQERVPDVRFFVYWFGGFFAPAGGPGAGADDDWEGVAVLDESDRRITGLIHSLFAAGDPSCGPFSAPERTVLFGRFAASVKSAVAAPLVEPATRRRMGMLVLASDDAARLAPGKGTMFLVQLVQLIECACAPAPVAAPRDGRRD